VSTRIIYDISIWEEIRSIVRWKTDRLVGDINKATPAAPTADASSPIGSVSSIRAASNYSSTLICNGAGIACLAPGTRRL
jgi:hypothetical protein